MLGRPTVPALEDRQAAGNKVLTQVTPHVRPYFFNLRRCTRVLRSSLRCFFFDMRLRRFLMTEPIRILRCRGRFALRCGSDHKAEACESTKHNDRLIYPVPL